ncbi:hypothetical protein O181_015775 [Austropuccinia psidii MF-1]|uniref:Integrase catalytic domain-containing protein n=1 Tax=Austropuccinia psidii MF-1 TaxID=1389203 RepID=A0A9Q3C3K7_9BASI|nr:hypothetical protein [Austropuccinia psidii MF-1]
MGPFVDDAQGFHYLLTIRDHVLTYGIVYPLKSLSKAPEAILEAVKQLQVCLGATPKALRTDNAQEFTSTMFTGTLVKLGGNDGPKRNACTILEVCVLLSGFSAQLSPGLPMCKLLTTSGAVRNCAIHHNAIPVWGGWYRSRTCRVTAPQSCA